MSVYRPAPKTLTDDFPSVGWKITWQDWTGWVRHSASDREPPINVETFPIRDRAEARRAEIKLIHPGAILTLQEIPVTARRKTMRNKRAQTQLDGLPVFKEGMRLTS